MLLPAKRSSALLAMLSSKSVFICNRLHAGRYNGGQITIGLLPRFDALVRKEFLHPAAQILSQKLKNIKLSCDIHPRFYLTWA